MQNISLRRLIPLLVSATLICCLLLTGCVSHQFEASGWDGLQLSDDTLFVCSNGRFLALDISEQTVRDFTPLDKDSGSSSLFGCGGSSAPRLTCYSAPVISGSLFYAATYIGDVFAIDTQSGAIKWSYETDHQIVGGPVVAEDAIIVASGDKIYKFDSITGTRLWEPVDTSGKIWGTPIVWQDTIFFGNLNHKIYSVDLESGDINWEKGFSGAFASTPLAVNDTLYIGSLDNKFYALNINDGSTKWEFETDNWVWTKAAYHQGTVFFGSFGGSVYAINAETGALDAGWGRPYQTETGDRIRAMPVIVDDVLVIGSQDDHVYGLDINDGTQSWATLRYEDDIMADPCVSGSTVYFLDKDHYVHAINGESGSRLWSKLVEID